MSMTSSGVFTVSYQLEPAESDTSLPETIYIYTLDSDGQTPLYLAREACEAKVYPYGSNYTYNNGTPEYLVGTGIGDWCDVTGVSSGSNSGMVVTVTGSAADLFRYSNKLYIGFVDPRVTGGSSEESEPVITSEEELDGGEIVNDDEVSDDAVTVVPTSANLDEDELESEEEALESGDVDIEVNLEDEAESSEGASAPKKASKRSSNLSLATVELEAADDSSAAAEDVSTGDEAADPEESDGLLGMSAQVFFAQGLEAGGSVDASWIEASVSPSDEGDLVSGRLLVTFDEGAQPAEVYAWAVAASEVPARADQAWGAVVSPDTLVYSSDSEIEQWIGQQESKVAFEYFDDTRVGVLTLTNVPCAGLLDGDGTLHLVVCVVDRSTSVALASIASSLGSQVTSQDCVQAYLQVGARNEELLGEAFERFLQERTDYVAGLLAAQGQEEAAGQDDSSSGEPAAADGLATVVEPAAGDGADGTASAGAVADASGGTVDASVAGGSADDQAAGGTPVVADGTAESPEQTADGDSGSVADQPAVETAQVEAPAATGEAAVEEAPAEAAGTEPTAEVAPVAEVAPASAEAESTEAAADVPVASEPAVEAEAAASEAAASEVAAPEVAAPEVAASDPAASGSATPEELPAAA
jgi:hypothetical protein